MLIERNYPPSLIKYGIDKAKKISLEELRKPKIKTAENNIITFVHTQNPNNIHFSGIISQALPLLKSSNKMRKVLEKNKFIMSKRQAPNLKKTFN